MERKDNYSDETKQAAQKLFDANMEMLHVYQPDKTHCTHCGKARVDANFDEECPALLRCALLSVGEASRKVEPYQGCGICGGKMVTVRGRHPRDDERLVCPTCAVERLEQIQQISSSEYGQAKASPLIRPVSGDSSDGVAQAGVSP